MTVLEVLLWGIVIGGGSMWLASLARQHELTEEAAELRNRIAVLERQVRS